MAQNAALNGTMGPQNATLNGTMTPQNATLNSTMTPQNALLNSTMTSLNDTLTKMQASISKLLPAANDTTVDPPAFACRTSYDPKNGTQITCDGALNGNLTSELQNIGSALRVLLAPPNAINNSTTCAAPAAHDPVASAIGTIIKASSNMTTNSTKAIETALKMFFL